MIIRVKNFKLTPDIEKMIKEHEGLLDEFLISRNQCHIDLVYFSEHKYAIKINGYSNLIKRNCCIEHEENSIKTVISKGFNLFELYLRKEKDKKKQ